MLQASRQHYYPRILAAHIQRFVNNYKNCIKAKPYPKRKLKPPLQRICDPCYGPNVITEVDLLGELPNSKGLTHILTATNVFSRNLFAVPQKKPDSSSGLKALIHIFTPHGYVRGHILTDKASASTSQVLEKLMDAPGNQIDHVAVKHAQTIGKIECSHQRLKQTLKISVKFDSPQWKRYVSLAVMAQNTTYE